MVKIKVRQKICSSRERIWDVISDVDNDGYFWRGLTSIRNLSRTNGALVREVVLGIDIKCIQSVTAWAGEKITTRWLEGVIKGIREVSLVPIGNTTLLEIQMNYEFPGVKGPDSKLLAKLFQNEAQMAADLIKGASERYRDSGLTLEKPWVN